MIKSELVLIRMLPVVLVLLATCRPLPPTSSPPTNTPTLTNTPLPIPTPVPRPASARIIHQTCDTKDVVVAEYDVASESDADATGASDATAAIQQALDNCYANGGGTVWVPAGTYKVT